jgi:hypothetical protein
MLRCSYGGGSFSNYIIPTSEWKTVIVDVTLISWRRTDASSGMQILMNDFEGVPPYPLCVDDELITTEGNLPQPVNRPSYMTGFVANVQLMQILSECMRRHRTYQTAPMDTDVYAILMWIERAQTQMRQIIQGLPDVLGPNPPQGSVATDQMEVFATQRANLLITAVSAEFALVSMDICKAFLAPC